MLLACDIGNTNFKFALFDKGVPVRHFMVAGNKFSRALLENLSFTDAAISSVIPDRTLELREIFIEQYRCRPFVISQDVNLNIKLDYHAPHTLGVDRICSIEGALVMFKNHPLFKKYSDKFYLITIDSGTATTINIVAYDKRFTGGMIIPGIDTMFNSLNKNTAQLPRVSADSFSSFIGKNTEASIASGVINSTIGLIERTYNYLKSEGAEEIVIYLTGGNAPVLSSHINFPFITAGDLVLLGINAIFERNRGE